MCGQDGAQRHYVTMSSDKSEISKWKAAIENSAESECRDWSGTATGPAVDFHFVRRVWVSLATFTSRNLPAAESRHLERLVADRDRKEP